MPIPKLKDGVLPPHIGDPANRDDTSPYPATVLELCEAFGGSPQRRAILKGYIGLRNLLHQLETVEGFQWVDGQFLERDHRKGQSPDHIQVVTFCQPSARWKDPDFGHLTSVLHNDKIVRAQYQVDHTPVLLCWPPNVLVDHTRHWCSLLSHQKSTWTWKGLLRIELNTPETDEAALQYLAAKERS